MQDKALLRYSNAVQWPATLHTMLHRVWFLVQSMAAGQMPWQPGKLGLLEPGFQAATTAQAAN